MEEITTEKKYNEKVEAFETIYKDESIPLEDKIKLCEEFAYCDYVKGSGRIDFAAELAEMYLKANRYQDVITFINIEFKSHFKNDSDWWKFIAAAVPSYTFYVIDACIALKDYSLAKGALDGLKINRTEMLKMHPNDGFTNQCKYWYARVIAKYAQIYILEGNISSAFDCLVNEPIFENYKIIECYYYLGLIATGNKDSRYKDTELAVNCFSNLSNLNIHDYVEAETNMIVESNYYLGLIYATEDGYKDKQKAIAYLTKAKELGYSITDEEIQRLTENIIDSTTSAQTDNNNSKSSGCYVATCIYGSYDCPPVWTLRRFRDDILSKNALGKLFIRVYYTISPTVVKVFGKYKWFHKIWKKPLDTMVRKLKQHGLEDTPYND